MSRRVRSSVCLVVLLTLACVASLPSRAEPLGPGSPAFAQAEKPPATTRLRQWTRARLEAAKKRWARNNEKFSACSKELAETKKTKRISLHDQGHFLDACMRRP